MKYTLKRVVPLCQFAIIQGMEKVDNKVLTARHAKRAAWHARAERQVDDRWEGLHSLAPHAVTRSWWEIHNGSRKRVRGIDGWRNESSIWMDKRYQSVDAYDSGFSGGTSPSTKAVDWPKNHKPGAKPSDVEALFSPWPRQANWWQDAWLARIQPSAQGTPMS